MHKLFAALLLCLVLASQAPVPAAAQARNPATQGSNTKRRVVEPKAKQAAPADSQAQERKELLFQGSGFSLSSVTDAFSAANLDPVQMALGAALLLIVRSILVRIGRFFKAVLRFLLGLRHHASPVVAAPPPVQYVLPPQQYMPQQAGPPPPMMVQPAAA